MTYYVSSGTLNSTNSTQFYLYKRRLANGYYKTREYFNEKLTSRQLSSKQNIKQRKHKKEYTDLRSLDLTFHSLFMKLLKTSSRLLMLVEIVNLFASVYEVVQLFTN